MPLEFSAQSKQRIERVLSRYPNKQAALLPVLHIAQDEFGHLPDAVIELVRQDLRRVAGPRLRRRHLLHDVPPRAARAERADGLHEHLLHAARRLRHPAPHREKLGIKAGETTPDGAFTLVEEECLAACANAPMMICGNDYFLDLTPEKVDTMLEDLRKRWREQQKIGAAQSDAARRGPVPGRRSKGSRASMATADASNLKIVTKNFGVADSHKLSVYTAARRLRRRSARR